MTGDVKCPLYVVVQHTKWHIFPIKIGFRDLNQCANAFPVWLITNRSLQDTASEGSAVGLAAEDSILQHAFLSRGFSDRVLSEL